MVQPNTLFPMYFFDNTQVVLLQQSLILKPYPICVNTQQICLTDGFFSFLSQLVSQKVNFRYCTHAFICDLYNKALYTYIIGLIKTASRTCQSLLFFFFFFFVSFFVVVGLIFCPERAESESSHFHLILGAAHVQYWSSIYQKSVSCDTA